MSDGTSLYDLRSLFKAVGRFEAHRALDVSPLERQAAQAQVEVLDETTRELDGDALEVAGFVDGIQATLCVTHRHQRPVYLYYVASGAVGSETSVLGAREKVGLVCAENDVEWATTIASGVPIETMGGGSPPELERRAHQIVSGARDAIERELISSLLRQGCGNLVVDGSLLGRDADARLFGVVKTTQSQWLDDESGLWGLRQGWRSPRFRILGTGEAVDRYSCYVQLTDKSDGAWNNGLIRVEAYDLDSLDALGFRCLAERQSSSSKDPRRDRHLGSVLVVEEFLRARRPAIFEL